LSTPKDLEDRIAAARGRAAHGEVGQDRLSPDADSASALGFGLRAGGQFVAAVVGGGSVGWLIDRWLGTSPFGLLIVMIVCFVAALANVWLTMTKAVDAATTLGAAKEDRDTEEVDGESS